ncbi:MAG: peptidoglycan-binding protein [Candidatus Eisenbacteria bacterium]|nr:peptidoglycan-binding protein [Candidatus Eisenbacteria bacterium]
MSLRRTSHDIRGRWVAQVVPLLATLASATRVATVTKVTVTTVILAATVAIVTTVANAAPVETQRERRERGVDLLEGGRAAEALAVFDSLLIGDLTDLGAGYLAARAEADLGRPGRARCRWLEVEVVAEKDQVGRLARHDRRRTERELADRQLGLGAAWFSSEAPVLAAPGIALLPLESLGGDVEGPYYGLTWSYLLFDALRGSRLCPAPIPSTLLALDLVTAGRGVRLPADIATQPLNTVGGLRGRLALLPGGLGGGVLESRSGDWDDRLREALRFFQQTQGLAVTGEADPETQRRLETVFRSWLESPPVALAPNLVPRVLSVLGSMRAVRGTYRIEAGEVRVQISIVDAAGQPTHPEPILLDFPLDETAVNARRAAAEIARLSGGRLSEWIDAPAEIGFGRWNSAAQARLVFDRGLPRMETRRWEELPKPVREWEPLRAWVEDSVWDSRDREWAERDFRRAWIASSSIDPHAAHDAFMRGLGGGSVPYSGPSPSAVVGTLGRIRIHGEGP